MPRITKAELQKEITKLNQEIFNLLSDKSKLLEDVLFLNKKVKSLMNIILIMGDVTTIKPKGTDGIL